MWTLSESIMASLKVSGKAGQFKTTRPPSPDPSKLAPSCHLHDGATAVSAGTVLPAVGRGCGGPVRC